MQVPDYIKKAADARFRKLEKIVNRACHGGILNYIEANFGRCINDVGDEIRILGFLRDDRLKRNSNVFSDGFTYLPAKIMMFLKRFARKIGRDYEVDG